VYGIRKELSVTVSDVMFRRLGFTSHSPKEVVPVVADVMAAELKWSSSTTESNIQQALSHLNTN
jgi:glycerol-3-phosphate dehydrogenase